MVSLNCLYCDNSYITSSASDVSALLVCIALHPKITCRHCSKFKVAPMSIWTSQNNSAVKQPISCFWFMKSYSRHVGKLPGSYSSTVSIGWIRLYLVSAQSPTCLRRESSRQTWVAPVTSLLFSQVHAVVNHAHELINIPEYTVHFRAYIVHGSQDPGCDKPRVNYILVKAPARVHYRI